MMKNILVVRSKINIGGPGALVLAVIRELKKRGYEVVLVCGGGERVEEIREMGVSCQICESLLVGKRRILKNFVLVFKLKSILKEYDVDAVYGFNSAATFMVYLAAKLSRKKIRFVNALLGNGKYYFHKIMPFKHICMSEEHKKELIQHGLREEKLQVNYPSTLDEALFCDNIKGYFRKELNVNSDDILVGLVMCGTKGYRKFGRLVLALCREFDNIHFAFVGNSKAYDVYREELLNSDFENRIHFVGVRKDIPEVMHAIDILSHLKDPVMDTLETFGMVLTEAMLMNTVVVASNDGGIKEIVEDGVTGFLVNNEEEYLSAMRKLVTDKSLRTNMSIAGKDKARNKFTIQKHVDILESLLND